MLFEKRLEGEVVSVADVTSFRGGVVIIDCAIIPEVISLLVVSIRVVVTAIPVLNGSAVV